MTLFSLIFTVNFAFADQQLEFDFGHPNEILASTFFASDNIQVSYDVPEEITKAWDERDFGFEIADGYYGYGPSATYEIYDKNNKVIGYMLAQTLSYSEDPEYHVAYTVCDTKGVTVVELEYQVYQYSEINDIPFELRPTPEEDEE